MYIFKLNDYITCSEFVVLISICRHMWSNTMLYRESILMDHVKLTLIPMKLGTIQFIEAEAFISTSFETHQCWVSIANSIFNRQIEGLNHANANRLFNQIRRLYISRYINYSLSKRTAKIYHSTVEMNLTPKLEMFK